MDPFDSDPMGDEGMFAQGEFLQESAEPQNPMQRLRTLQEIVEDGDSIPQPSNYGRRPLTRPFTWEAEARPTVDRATIQAIVEETVRALLPRGRSPSRSEKRRISETPRHLGAASPGRRTPRPLAEDDDILGEMEYRRGVFPTEIPKAALKWEPAKWKAHLDFQPFEPQTEVELERWFEDASEKIVAQSATARVVLSVLQLICAPEFRYAVKSVFRQLQGLVYVEDMADALARRMFVGYRELQELETKLLAVGPRPSVFAALAAHRRIEETYTYMCKRRSRVPILQGQQLSDLAISLLPSKVAKQIRKNNPERVWEVRELFSLALKVENVLMRDVTRLAPKSVLATTSNPMIYGHSNGGSKKKRVLWVRRQSLEKELPAR